ncbi:MAG TPA: hypothetical protein VF505_09140 [Thermoanaerobaculia bacterium]
MTADLDQILSVDEESRARVDLAQKQIDRAMDEARLARARAIDARQQAAAAVVERDLARIREEGETRLAERRAALDQYLARLSAAGEQQLDAAAQIYARIVSGDAEEKIK